MQEDTRSSSLTAQDLVPEELTLSPLEDICQGLGITENNSVDDVRIYPDPSQGTFIVSFNNPAGDASLSVISPLGRPIYHKDDLPESNGRTEIHIDLNVPSGIYMIRVNSNKKDIIKKVIIE